ncbi:MAG: hypothetical protein PHO41_00895 [Eubacteriales bacterium]|nr:hypothetical protein [Eubacteriales bacterium]
MQIIITHDVDHLMWHDHLTDLYYPKLWVRESLSLLRRRISAKEWALRMTLPCHRELHHIAEVMRTDKEHGVPSTFFFGMANGLGLSYSRKQALSAIRMVQENGFTAGIHGIAYGDANGMRAEYEAFAALTGHAPQGIRMHYVREGEHTLQLLSDTGYRFDSTVFDKQARCCIKAPYPVDDMWEFPLTVMDSYLPYDAQKCKQITTDILRRAEADNIGYCTILFHDIYFSPAYPVYRDWYTWLLGYCRQQGYGFTGFQEAIEALEAARHDGE